MSGLFKSVNNLYSNSTISFLRFLVGKIFKRGKRSIITLLVETFIMKLTFQLNSENNFVNNSVPFCCTNWKTCKFIIFYAASK